MTTTSISVIEDAIDVAVAAPLVDGAGDPLRIVSVQDAPNGSVTLTANGVILYSPDDEYNGTDSFTYVTEDADGVRATNTVEVSILPGHEQPATSINPAIAPELEPSGDALILRRVAEIPNDAESGGAPRINGSVTHDGAMYVWTEGSASGESRIYRLTEDGQGGYDTAEWLDLGAAVEAATGRQVNNENVVHGGLRSITFHPDFETNGRFYISIMEDRPTNTSGHTYISDVDNPIGGDSVLVEWTVDLETGQVIEDSYREVFRVGMPVFDHTIRAITFNEYAEPGDEDYGLLYIAHGDGSVQSATAGGGQNNDALGTILRIDPLQNGADPYSVPASNPYVGNPNMIDEAYAIGFRNPHTISFNRAEDGSVHLIAVDVGRDNFDEINIVTAGGNYGWSELEGPLVHLDGGGFLSGVDDLPNDGSLYDYVFPAAFYAQDPNGDAGFGRFALAGGHVINNGSELDGRLIIGDFSDSGRIFTIDFAALLAADTTVDPGEALAGALSWATPGEVQIYLDDDGDPDTLPVAFSHYTAMIDSFRADFRFGEGLYGELIVTNKRTGEIFIAVNTLPMDHPYFQSTRFDRVELRGTPEDNELIGSALDEYLFGFGGDDVLVGRGGNDTLEGGGRADTLDGGDGNDTLLGGSGADDLSGRNGNDILTGGWGTDTFRYLDPNEGSDTITDFTQGQDVIDLRLAGITGRSGLDIDTTTSPGDTILSFGRTEITLQGITGRLLNSDFVFLDSGTPNDDEIIGTLNDETFDGRAGNDRILGKGGDDLLDGGADKDMLLGGGGNDTLKGGSGADRLNGGFGTDILRGGAGRDTLIGSNGNDTLTGGAGTDIFVFNRTGDTDTVTDFTQGEDVLRVKPLGIATLTEITQTNVNGDLHLTFGTNTIILSGLAGTALDEGDFVFA